MTDPPPPRAVGFSSFPDLAAGVTHSAPVQAAGAGASSSNPPPLTAAPSFSSFPGIFGAPASSSASATAGAPKSKRQRSASPGPDRGEAKERYRATREQRAERDRRRDKERGRHRDGDGDRGLRREDRRGKEAERGKDHDHDGRDRDREEVRERAVGPDRDRDRHRDRARERHREGDREDDGSRDRYRDRHGNGDKDKERGDRERRRDRHRDRDRDRDRDREPRRERDRDERRKEIEDRRERERRKAAVLAGVPAEERSSAAPQAGGDNDDAAAPWYEAASTRRPATEDAPHTATSVPDVFVDTVGDKDVIRYAATSSFSAPRYRHDFGGRVLGLNEGLRIVFSKDRTQKGVEVAPRGRPYIPRYSSRVIDGTSSRHLARILMRPNTDPASSDLTQSFTPFDVPRLKDREDNADLPEYRALGNDEGSDEEELAAIQAALGKVSTFEETVRHRTAELETLLRAEPTNIPQWLAYSKLHLRLSPDAADGSDSALADPATQPTTRANAEMTVAILGRALAAHPDNFASAELHAAYLRAAEVFWPPSKITERWQNVIRALGERGADEEDMMGLYLGYIAWREGQGIGEGAAEDGTGVGAGGVDEVVEVYLDCLYKLNSGTVREQEGREENQVYLLLRACLFLRQAGFAERALAVFQALLEITFFKPPHLRQPAPPFDRELWFRGVLEEFEDFWDSEVPRLGEPGARGWAAAHASRDPVAALATSTQSRRGTDADGDAFARWLAAERHAERSLPLPGRVTDLDAPDDDPYHFVIFSDVRGFLFPIQTPAARLQLIYAFFSLLGLPFAPPDAPTMSAAATDPHLRWTVVDNPVMRAAFWPPRPSVKRVVWQTVGGEPMEPERPRSLASPFGCPVKSWVAGRSTLFGRHGWFHDVDGADLEHVDVEFVRNVFATLRPLVPDPSFVLSSFAFEAAISPKALVHNDAVLVHQLTYSAIKLAKTVLAEDRENLALWDGYARLERQRGKLSAARQVYVTALQAAAQRTTADDRLDEADLWAAWAAMEWEEGEEERAVEVLVMAGGSREGIAACANPAHSPVRRSAIAMLKAKQYYAAAITNSPATLLLGSLYIALTEGIEGVRDRLLEIIASLPVGHPQAEETFQLLAHVIYTHTSRHPTPPALARSVLEQAIKAFPNNTMFASLYLWGETGARVHGRVHKLASRAARGSIVAQLWAVWAESMSAGQMFWLGGGAERVRRVFNRALAPSDSQQAQGRHSAALWALYIEFEIHQGRPAVAKALLYRALAAVGGCKALYLLAFENAALRRAFTARELRGIAEVMGERGLRVRVLTETFWDDVDTEDEGEDGEEEERTLLEGGDYEYGMLREREVLKPY